jgi:hypothetical protein
VVKQDLAKIQSGVRFPLSAPMERNFNKRVGVNKEKKSKSKGWGKLLGVAMLGVLATANYVKANQHGSVDLVIEGGVEELDKKTVIALKESKGIKVGGLLSKYLGVESGTVLGETVEVNFAQALEGLWSEKIARAEKSKSREEIIAASKSYLGAFVTERTHPETSTFATLKDFSASIEQSISPLRENIDWSKLHPATKEIASHINSQMLISYSMTELFPAETTVSVEIYEEIIRKEGPQFFAAIPALYDNQVSAGFHQFTPHALYKKDEETRGASLINELVLDKSLRIPNSVSELTNYKDQFKAAFLFAVYNIDVLLKSDAMKPELLEKFKAQQFLKVFDYALVQYIASAHHAPGTAREGMIDFIQKEMVGSHKEEVDVERVRKYIQETNDFYKEVLERTR